MLQTPDANSCGKLGYPAKTCLGTKTRFQSRHGLKGCDLPSPYCAHSPHPCSSGGGDLCFQSPLEVYENRHRQKPGGGLLGPTGLWRRDGSEACDQHISHSWTSVTARPIREGLLHNSVQWLSLFSSMLVLCHPPIPTFISSFTYTATDLGRGAEATELVPT